jgi:hypothetical protein
LVQRRTTWSRVTPAHFRSIDNGYSNVLHDPKDTFGLGKYRVYYSAGDKAFGGAIPGESDGAATLYATSPDGLVWSKPHLHRYSWHNSTANNILFDGTTAVGIIDDAAHDSNASTRFKIWGNLPEAAPSDSDRLTFTAQLAGSAVSANGLNFSDYRRLQNPSSSKTVKDTLRFDAQASLYYDRRQDKYVGTMRAFRPCSSCGTCPIWWQPHGGCQNDLSSSCTAAECNRTVRAVGTSTSSSGNFQTSSWGKNVEVLADHTDPTRQFYSQVSWPYYNIYMGIAMVFSALDPPNTWGKGKVHCQLVWSADGTRYHRVSGPTVDFIPLGSVAQHAYDSHVCFASAIPVEHSRTAANGTRIYYMGGDGPHYSPPWGDPLHRNTTLSMATMRPQGFVGLVPQARPMEDAAGRGPGAGVGAGGGRGETAPNTGKAVTVPLTVTGARLVVTADTAPAGTVAVTVNGIEHDSEAASSEQYFTAVCTPISGRNTTDEALEGCDLSAMVGRNVTLQLSVEDAALYTVGFQAASV